MKMRFFIFTMMFLLYPILVNSNVNITTMPDGNVALFDVKYTIEYKMITLQEAAQIERFLTEKFDDDSMVTIKVHLKNRK